MAKLHVVESQRTMKIPENLSDEANDDPLIVSDDSVIDEIISRHFIEKVTVSNHPADRRLCHMISPLTSATAKKYEEKKETKAS